LCWGLCRKLSRPDLNPEEGAAEQQLAEQAQLQGPKCLRLLASRIVDGLDPESPEPVADQLQQDRRNLELRQRRDGMWQLHGKLTNTVGAQLHAVLDPLTRPRTTTVEIDGKTVEIADERHYGQRMHDALQDACGRLLIPPRWIDPQQQPQLNARIRRLAAQRQLSRRRLGKAA
jgi:hypothetical protein